MLFINMCIDRTRVYSVALTLPTHTLTIASHGGEEALPWVGDAAYIVRRCSPSRTRL
jgi:hypothetical protein